MEACLITDVRLDSPCTDSAYDRARRLMYHRSPTMLADSTLLALRALTTVLAECRPTALPPDTVLQIPDPPHSLHLDRSRPCSQIPDPPHSLHRERRRPCSQIEPPPHSLHRSRPQIEPHRTPCTESADDRARRFQTHRTPCTESADDRARRFQTHRTPCTESAASRADKRCTPCTATDTSPRARTAPSCEGLSSASSPASSPPLHLAPCPRLRHTRRASLSRSAARSSSSSP